MVYITELHHLKNHCKAANHKNLLHPRMRRFNNVLTQFHEGLNPVLITSILTFNQRVQIKRSTFQNLIASRFYVITFSLPICGILLTTASGYKFWESFSKLITKKNMTVCWGMVNPQIYHAIEKPNLNLPNGDLINIY